MNYILLRRHINNGCISFCPILQTICKNVCSIVVQIYVDNFRANYVCYGHWSCAMSFHVELI
jgi:hypothetical protein